LLKLNKACGSDGTPKQITQTTSKKSIVSYHIFILITVFGCHLLSLWKEVEVITLPKPNKDPNSLKIYIQ